MSLFFDEQFIVFALLPLIIKVDYFGNGSSWALKISKCTAGEGKCAELLLRQKFSWNLCHIHVNHLRIPVFHLMTTHDKNLNHRDSCNRSQKPNFLQIFFIGNWRNLLNAKSVLNWQFKSVWSDISSSDDESIRTNIVLDLRERKVFTFSICGFEIFIDDFVVSITC